MFVAQIVVEDDGCSVEGPPLHILLYREPTEAQNVVIGYIADVVSGSLYGADTPRAVVIGRCYLERQLWQDIGIYQADALGVRTHQVGIAILNHGGRCDDGRVQIRDAWTVDAAGFRYEMPGRLMLVVNENFNDCASVSWYFSEACGTQSLRCLS